MDIPVKIKKTYTKQITSHSIAARAAFKNIHSLSFDKENYKE